MRHRNRFGAIALAVLAAAALGSCGTQDRTVAKVGDRAVTAADFEDAARSQPYLGLDPSPDAKRRLLDELIDRELLVAEARRLGLDKGPELAGARRKARDEVLPEMLYQRVVSGRVSVSEAELKAVWDAQGEELRLAQIFSLDEGGARTVMSRLAAGEPFAAVARTLSRDRSAIASGGELGYLTAGQMPDEIERAVRGLPVGKWTQPILTPVGYYVVLVEDRRPRQREDYGQVRTQISSLLRQRKERTLVLTYVARLKTSYGMKFEDAGFGVLGEKWQNRTAEELLASGGDLAKLGFTDEDLALPLATYKGGAYTVKDFFADFVDRSTLDRPPAGDDATLRLFVQDRATFRLLLVEAQQRGLDREPETARRLRDREASYLVSRIYEQVVVPAAQVTPEERQRIAAQPGAGNVPPGQAGGPADVEARLFEQKRRVVLMQLLERLRKTHPPQVNEKALGDVPWPVPPKENA